MDLIKWHLKHKEPFGIDELYYDYVFEGDDIVCQVRGKSAEQCRSRAQEIVEAHNSSDDTDKWTELEEIRWAKTG